MSCIDGCAIGRDGWTPFGVWPTQDRLADYTWNLQLLTPSTRCMNRVELS